ncbi:hypothetical protein RI367_000625 [Sorochytrium milnesiophthora]
MLHELLVAMTGHPGDIFVPYPPPPLTPTTFAIRTDYPFLHPAERNSLNRLAQLGFWHAAALRFVRSEKLNARGAYTVAFAQGIERVLTDYQHLIIATEESVLKREDDQQGRTPISMLVATFSKQHSILKAVYDTLLLVQGGASGTYHGCKLVNLVQKRTVTGDAAVAQAFARILHACNTVLFRQLSAWLLYGQLHDPHAEFFIKCKVSEGNMSAETNAQDVWSADVTVDQSMLPYLISPALSDTVLLVGKAAATVRAARNRDELVPPAAVEEHLKSLTSLLATPRLRNMEFEAAISAIHKDYTGALWRVVVMDEKLLDYVMSFRKYYLMGQGDFFQLVLDEFDALKAKTSSRMSAPSLHELNSVLRRVASTVSQSDSTLLGRYRLLVVEGAEKQRGKDSTAVRLLYHSPFGSKWFGVNIKLAFEVGWPLNLIFTPKDMDKYNAVFSFLMALRRIQLRVTRLHLALARHRERLISLQSDSSNMEHMRTVWNTRAFIMSFLDTLLTHFQMDIIESRFQTLLEEIMALSSRDYSVLERLHADYIDGIVKWTYLSESGSSLLRDILAGLLDRAERFCGVVELTLTRHTLRQWDATQLRIGRADDVRDRERKAGGAVMMDITRTASFSDINLTDEESACFEIGRIDEAFRKEARFFYSALQGVQQSGVQAVDQLLTRLDYNRYYSLDGGRVSSSVGQRIMEDDLDRLEEEDRWERIQVEELMDAEEGWQGELSRRERSFR